MTVRGAPVLSLCGLAVEFATKQGPVRAVDDVSFTVHRGQTVALVGESGSGKSVTAMSVMRLPGRSGAAVTAGEILFCGRDGVTRDLARLTEPQMRAIRGNEIGIVFQEPMTSLNPVLTIGSQIAEAIRLHRPMPASAAAREAQSLLRLVEIRDPDRQARCYPHQLSGGMRQRVMIAMALCCRPQLLLADEPTTALDVTIQAQILSLLRKLQAEFGMGILFITHNLGVVAEVADWVNVMYAGQLVESAPVDALFDRPLHPYTRALLASLPDADAPHGSRRRLSVVGGQVPDPRRPPPGCRFEPRCGMALRECGQAPPRVLSAGADRQVRCPRWCDA